MHQIKGFTLLNLCCVYPLNVQGCMHWQAVSSDQSAECTGIQQEYRMLWSPCRVEQTVSALHPENILCSAASHLPKNSENKHFLLETFFCVPSFSLKPDETATITTQLNARLCVCSAYLPSRCFKWVICKNQLVFSSLFCSAWFFGVERSLL